MERNTMAYGTDHFQFRKSALLKAAVPWDFSDETSVSGFNISGTEPAGTRRRVIFAIDDVLYKFGNSGPIEYQGRGELADVLEYGNTVGELLDVKSVVNWAGKVVYPIIALDAPSDSQVFPTIKLSANVNCYNDRYLKNEYSQVFELAENARIADLKADVFLNGHANATCYCRLKDKYTGWGDYVELNAAVGKVATHIQFKINYVLTTIDGSDQARVNFIRCHFTCDSDLLASDFFEVVTAAQDYDAPLGTCYLIIQHSELNGASLRAFVNFAKPHSYREHFLLGTATGSNQTLFLPNSNVDPASLHLEIAGKTFSDYFFDTEEGTLTLTADSGTAIYASYEHGASVEQWQEMTLQEGLQTGLTSSKYIYNAAEGGKVASIKIVGERTGGHVDNQVLGVGTGKLQIFHLDKRALAHTLSCNCAFSYDEDAQILRCLAPIDASINVSFDFLSPQPSLSAFTAGFAI